MRARFAVLALVMTAGCSDTTSSSAPREFTIAPTAQWAGGQVTIAGFRASDDLPVLLAGADTLAVERLDDSTVRATLPGTISGSIEIQRAHRQTLDSIGTVQVAGYLGHDVLPGANLGGELTVIQRAGSPWIIGENWFGGATGVLAVDAALGTVFTDGDLSVPTAFYGVGLTARADAFMLRDSTGALGRWQLWPAPVLLQASPIANTFRHLAQLNDSIFLVSTSQSIASYKATAGGVTQMANATSVGAVSQLRLSPTGALAAFVTTAPSSQGRVFDARSGAFAYIMPSIHSMDAIEFSPDGSRIAAVSFGLGGQKFLFLIDAATGVSLDSTPLPATSVNYITFDPDRPRLYTYAVCNAHPTVQVYNSESLELEGTLVGSDAAPPCFVDAALAYDTFRQRLYVVSGNQPADRFTFEVLP